MVKITLKKSMASNMVVEHERNINKKHYAKCKNPKRLKASRGGIPGKFTTQLTRTPLVEIDEEARMALVELNQCFFQSMINFHERTVIREIIIMRCRARFTERRIKVLENRYADEDYWQALRFLQAMRDDNLLYTGIRRPPHNSKKKLFYMNPRGEWQQRAYYPDYGFHHRHLLLDCLRRQDVSSEAIQCVHDSLFFQLKPQFHKKNTNLFVNRQFKYGPANPLWKSDEIANTPRSKLRLINKVRKREQRQRDREGGFLRSL